MAELVHTRNELESRLSAEVETLNRDLEAAKVNTFELNARCADLDMERNLLLAKCMELQDVQLVLATRCAEMDKWTDAVAET